jgi:hypothetical protein
MLSTYTLPQNLPAKAAECRNFSQPGLKILSGIRLRGKFSC